MLAIVSTARRLSTLSALSDDRKIEKLDEWIKDLYNGKHRAQFYTYEQYTALLNNLRDMFPDLLKRDETHEKTSFEGRKIEIYYLTDNNPDMKKDVNMQHALMHAREQVTPQVLVTAVMLLLKGYLEQEAEALYLLKRRTLIFLPRLNPDGHFATGKDNMVRKNRRNTTRTSTCKGTRRGDGIGVDLNRNFAIDENNAAKQNAIKTMKTCPCCPTYPGPSAFSEPETQTLRDLVTRHQNEGKPIRTAVNWHSFLNITFVPDQMQRKYWPAYADLIESAGVTCEGAFAPGESKPVNFPCRAVGDIKYNSGDTLSWLTTKRIIAITPEVGVDSFYLSPDQRGGDISRWKKVSRYALMKAGCEPRPYFAEAEGVLKLWNRGMATCDNLLVRVMNGADKTTRLQHVTKLDSLKETTVSENVKFNEDRKVCVLESGVGLCWCNNWKKNANYNRDDRGEWKVSSDPVCQELLGYERKCQGFCGSALNCPCPPYSRGE